MQVKMYLLIGFLCLLSCCISMVALGQDSGADVGKKDSLNDTRPTIEEMLKNRQGTRFLALEKQGKVKRIRYYTGSTIEFKLKDDANLYRTAIEAVKDSAVVIHETVIPLSKFSSIYIRPKRPFTRVLSTFFMIAGVGYFTLDTVNNEFSPTGGTLMTSGALIVPSLALLLTLKKQRIKLNKQNFLKTILAF